MAKVGPRSSLVGRKDLGRWDVLRLGDRLPGGGWKWWCRCECGTEKQVNGGNLVNGLSKDCGCGRKASVSKIRRTHGESTTATYRIYRHMVSRCYDPNDKSYCDYGQKGVRVADVWLGEGGYERFVADVGHRPDETMSVERNSPAGNYEPGNVIWIPLVEQNRNKRNSVRITHGGVTKTLTEWASEFGMTPSKLNYRLRVKKMSFEEAVSAPAKTVVRTFEYQGRRVNIGELSRLTGIDRKVLYTRIVSCDWSVEKACSTPVETKAPLELTHNGETKSVAEWAQATGIPEVTLRRRLGKGWSVEQALTVPTAARLNTSG